MTAATGRVEINGAAAGVAELSLALLNYGHFTTMQVRDRGVRGFARHLDRLDRSSVEVFGRPLDPDRVREHVRHALGDDISDASLRVTVFSRDGRGLGAVASAEPDVLVTVGDAMVAQTSPLRVRAVAYERELPHIKHVGTFGLLHQARQARLAGFDDALLVDRHDRVTEGSVWNVGFYDGDQVIWPSAPALSGVAMQLLRAGLDRKGIPWAVRNVRTADLPSFSSAFFSNSTVPVRPVECVDDIGFTVDPKLTALLTECFETNPIEPI